MVEVIFTRGGMLDKYIGDGLMAIFGVPVVGSADADNALYVANDMIRALGVFNSRRPARIGANRDRHRAGYRRGAAGSVGRPKRMEYTAIGNNVNLAARLESAKTNIMVPLCCSRCEQTTRRDVWNWKVVRSFLYRKAQPVRLRRAKEDI